MAIQQMYVAPGSYGIWPTQHDNGKRADGQLEGTPIQIWFCGRERRDTYSRQTTVPCAHRTRQEARDCAR